MNEKIASGDNLKRFSSPLGNLYNFLKGKKLKLDKNDTIALIISAIVFVFWAVLLSYKYCHFGYTDWDFAIYAQLMWSLCRGDLSPSLFGMNFLANHSQYIAFLLIPIYFIFNHPMTLLILKIASYVTGGIFVYLLGKKIVSPLIALTLMIFFLMFPANIYALLFEFDFESLAIGLLLLSFYWLQTKRFLLFCLTIFLTALIKENISLLVAMLGIYLLIPQRWRLVHCQISFQHSTPSREVLDNLSDRVLERHSPAEDEKIDFDDNLNDFPSLRKLYNFLKGKKNTLKWILVPLLWGTGVFFLTMFIITPTLRESLGSSNPYLGLYKGLGHNPGEIAKTFLFHPIKIVQTVFTPENIDLFKELFAPLGFLPLASPQILLIGAPVFLQHLLSSNASEHTIKFHYAATIVPFVFLAALNSIAFLQKKIKPKLFLLFLGFITIFFAINLGRHMKDISHRVNQFQDNLDPARGQMARQIPKDAGVIATFQFLPKLSQRHDLYTLLNIIQNRQGLGWEPLERIPAASYALVDFNDPWIKGETIYETKPTERKKRMRLFFKNHWRVKDAANDVVLFEEARGRPPHNLVETASESFLSADLEQNILIDNKLLFLACEINNIPLKRKNILPLTLYWKAHQGMADNYLMTIDLKEKDQTISSLTRVIGYTILPTSSWEQGGYIKEHYWLLLPAGFQNEVSLEARFYSFETEKILPVRKMTDPEDSDLNSISIGKIFLRHAK